MNSTRFDPIHFVPKSGITLIEASAGTGKTYSITKIVERLISDGICKIDEILVLTFTETATQELRDRVRKGLIEAIEDAVTCANDRAILLLGQALDNFESASIYTIHGFCNRMLREFSVEAGIGSEFAIETNSKQAEAALELRIARDLQKVAEQNPLISPGIQAIDYSSNFVRQVLSLKASTDLQTGLSSAPKSLEQWFKGNFENLKWIWKNEGDNIRNELLAEDPPIARKRTAYKPECMAAMLDRLEQVFAGNGTLYLDFFLDLKSLSLSELTGPNVLRKNRSIQSFRFYVECDLAMATLPDLSREIVAFILEIKSSVRKRRIFEEQLLGFDDLLLIAHDLVCSNSNRVAEHFHQKYKVGLIDEFQDTDPVQFAILERIFLHPDSNASPRPLILIGDPKQAIYGFRGGDIFTYNAASKMAQERYFLDTNWRSCPAINMGVNELLKTGNHPFHYKWIDYQPVLTAPKNHSKSLIIDNNPASGIGWVCLEPDTSDHEKISQVADDIVNFLLSNIGIRTQNTLTPIRPDDIVVLVPDNHTGALIHDALGTRRVASTIFGGASVFQSSQALQLYAVLNALQNIRHFRLIRGAIAGAFFDPVLLKQILENSSGVWIEVLQYFTKACHEWQHRGLSAALSSLEQHFSWKLNLSRGATPHRSLANHQHLINLLLEQESSGSHDKLSLLEWFRQQIESPDSKDKDQLLQLDTDEEAVTIMTMHKSKGLEYPVVFIPALPGKKPKGYSYPCQYHDPETGKLLTLFQRDQISQSQITIMEEEHYSESLRTLYVAITRAEVYCRIYLQPEKITESAINAWLPEGEPLSDRIQKLSHPAPSVLTDSRPEISKIDEIASTLRNSRILNTPSTPPQIPKPISNLSFSGLIHGISNQEHDETDEPLLFSFNPGIRDLKQPKNLTIHDFDKGTNAGLFFHSLLETIEFTEPKTWKSLLEAKLIHFGYPTEPWMPVLIPWLDALVQQTLSLPDAATFHLDQIEPTLLFRESEFSYTIQWGPDTWARLQLLFEGNSWIRELNYQLPTISVMEKLLNTFVNGVIDFWTLKDGKVYLFDWKSNALGTDASCYTTETMQDAMSEHHYHLQYLLYICAINRYLRIVQTDYHYESCFGGVGYCFLRGVDKTVSNSGWFMTLPPAEFVASLEGILMPETLSLEVSDE